MIWIAVWILSLILVPTIDLDNDQTCMFMFTIWLITYMAFIYYKVRPISIQYKVNWTYVLSDNTFFISNGMTIVLFFITGIIILPSYFLLRYNLVNIPMIISLSYETSFQFQGWNSFVRWIECNKPAILKPTSSFIFNFFIFV